MWHRRHSINRCHVIGYLDTMYIRTRHISVVQDFLQPIYAVVIRRVNFTSIADGDETSVL